MLRLATMPLVIQSHRNRKSPRAATTDDALVPLTIKAWRIQYHRTETWMVANEYIVRISRASEICVAVLYNFLERLTAIE